LLATKGNTLNFHVKLAILSNFSERELGDVRWP